MGGSGAEGKGGGREVHVDHVVLALCVRAHMCTCVSVFMYVHVCVYMCARIRVYVYICAFVYACSCVSVFVGGVSEYVCACGMFVCVHAYMCLYTCVEAKS